MIKKKIVKRITITIEQDKFNKLEHIAKIQYRSISSYFAEWLDAYFLELQQKLVISIIQASEELLALENNVELQTIFPFKLDELHKLSILPAQVVNDLSNPELKKLTVSFFKKLKQMANVLKHHYQASTIQPMSQKYFERPALPKPQQEQELSPALNNLVNLLNLHSYTEDELIIIGQELALTLKKFYVKNIFTADQINSESNKNIPPDEESNSKGKLRGNIKSIYDDDEINHVDLPCLGLAAAGQPIKVLNDWDGQTCPVSKHLLGNYQHLSCYVVEVRGDSMEEEDIYDGDRVIIHHQEHAENGQIIIAMIDNKATLKKISFNNNQVQLLSRNKNMPPMIIDPNKLRVRGVFIYNLKKASAS